MADTKISALPAATTPLVGTEVLPIVQSSTTKKVSIADVTVGRDVTTAALLSTKTSAGAVVDVATIQNLSSTANTEAALFLSPTAATGNIRGARISGINDGSNVIGLKFYTGAGATITSKLEIDGAATGDVTLKTGNLVQGTAAKGVNFTANTPAAGMTSQLLNWSEEGTWTPIDGSGASLSFTTQDARYTKVGRLVTISASITYPVTADASDAAIAGLPFTTFNGTSGVDGGGPSYTDSATALMFLVAKNATVFDIRAAAGGAIRKNINMSTLTIRFTLTYTAA